MLLRSIRMPVKAQRKFVELPPRNKGMPGRVYVKIGWLAAGVKVIGRNMVGRTLRDYINCSRNGFPEVVSEPYMPITTFFLRKVITGNRKSLNISLSM